MNKTAIIYCRVSTNKQENDWDSLNRQEIACKEYCKNHWIDSMWVFKESYSWKTSNRPILKEAISNAIANKVNYFVVFDIDRFSRWGFAKYTQIKEELSNNWIKLQDTKNIIGDDKIVISNEKIDMWIYKWNKENSNEMTEMVMSAQAHIEWKKILQRTIPKEILLEQQWYQVRQANFWYKNERIKTPDWKKVIQIKDWEYWDCIIELFELRAKGQRTDKEIAAILNAKWYRNKKWKELKIWYLQSIIKNPVYAWVISNKWNWWEVIKTAYNWLISIETFNKANRWRIKIIKLANDDLVIEYKDKYDKEVGTSPIIEKRKNYNSDYPYAKVLQCPHCWWELTANTSKSKNWTLHYYYQCKWKWWVKHKNYSIRRDEVWKNIKSYFENIIIDEDILKLYDKLSEEVYNEQKEELSIISKSNINEIKKLELRKKEILSNIDKLLDFPSILESKNKELEDTKIKIEELKNYNEHSINQMNLERFKSFSKTAITHLNNIVTEAEKPELINLAFNIVFDWKIEYEKLSYHTPLIMEKSAILSQQKNPSCDEFSLNLRWQPHCESNTARRIWSPEF